MQRVFDKSLIGRTIIDPKTGNAYKIPSVSREESKAFKSKKDQKDIDDFHKKEPYRFLKQNSLLNEDDLLDWTFSKLDRVSDGFVEKAKRVKQVAEDFKAGKRYNVFLYGKQGRGKSTLTACLANDIVRNSPKTHCMIINASRVGRLVNTYNDSSVVRSQKTSDFEVMLKRYKQKCDVLVIDDLGKETNHQEEVREANNMIQDAWYRIADISLKKNKALVLTSNLSIAQLNQMYDPATLSRMLKGAKNHVIKFDADKSIGDMRLEDDSQ